MASFNKITIVGHLGRDPELRQTPNGIAVCNFSVATTEKRKDQETTTWFRVTVWDKAAENAAKYLTKGALVYVEGRARLNEYTDREGNHRSVIEVNATEVNYLLRKEGSSESPKAESAQHSTISDSDIPF